MVETNCALYRIDFCSDLTAVQAPIFNLGFMLEAAVENGARFLGLSSRRMLTRVELDCVNAHTWPELQNLDDYMGELFDRSWTLVENAPLGDLKLGSDEIGNKFSQLSALSFVRLDVAAELVSTLQGETSEWQKAFFGAVVDYGKLLKPALTAEVLLFELPQSEPVYVEGQRPEVRSKAA